MAIHKKSFMEYFDRTVKGGGMIFKGSMMKIFIPKRYEIHDLLSVKDTVRSLAIFQIFIAEEKDPYNMLLPAMITMYPSDTEEKTVDDIPYVIATFNKGDVFVDSLVIIKENFVISKMFIEFFRNGHMPPWLSYDQMAEVFDIAQVTCGATLPVPHATLEMMVAQCARYPTNLNLKYRYSKQDKPPTFLGLRNVTDIRDSTTSKLVGSYVMDGINSAIVNQSQERSEVEDLLRM